MPNEKIRPMLVRFDGVFPFEETFNWLVDYFKSRNYDYFEKNWKEKDATPAGKEITLRLYFERNDTQYIQSQYTIKWRMWDAHAAKSNSDLMRTRFELEVIPELVYDWQGYGDAGGSFTKKISEFFHRYIFVPQQAFEDQTLQQAQQFTDELKKRLKMHSTEGRK